MKWKGRERSSNVEDRRGMGGKGIAGIGGGVGIILLIVITLMGGNPTELLGDLTGGDQQNTTYEDGKTYKKPKLVLYTDQVSSACGQAGKSVGPFYCPGDQKLYIDLSFYDELQTKYGAPGDFAMAYVIAHEVGHHVQTLLGKSDEIMPLREQMSEEKFNKYLVRFELQADYYAGVWAHHAQGENLLEEGDLEEALTAANAVGDDTLQEKGQGYVVPESFTHGTSAQRERWFQKGFDNGTIEGGDTFKAKNL